MNWNDPASRARLIEQVGHDEYHRLQQAHFIASTVETVCGHSIRPVRSRFGRLFMVGATRKAFSTLAEAQTYARQNPAVAVAQ
jgi:hypothetical protein